MTDRRIPADQAIDQAAAVHARQLKADHQRRLEVTFNGVDISKMLSGVQFASERVIALNRSGINLFRMPSGTLLKIKPAHLADRRTIRLAGRPKHFIEYNGRLRLVDGGSPWT